MPVKKYLRMFVYAALGAVCLYTGISCAATLHKALHQPCLMAGAVRFSFLGYFMIAGIAGAVCVGAAALLVLLLLRNRKKRTAPDSAR